MLLVWSVSAVLYCATLLDWDAFSNRSNNITIPPKPMLKETTADSDLKLLRRVGLVWYCLLLR